MIGFIVEGFNDEITLKEIFPDAHYVITKGTRFTKRTKMDIKEAIDKCEHVFSLMDPDEPGQLMTTKIKEEFWDVTPILIDEEEGIAYRNNFQRKKIGVEHCRPEYLKKVITEAIYEEKYKYLDGYAKIQAKLHDKFYDGPDMHRRFQDDLFKEFGVEDHPKRDKCFGLAWEHGHSSGYGEVLIYFSEFVELIQP